VIFYFVVIKKSSIFAELFLHVKTMEVLVENIKRKGVITPCDFTKEEFWEEIRKAERGPFISLDELDSRLEEWKTVLNGKK
jgi:hypothetical protein